MKYRIMERDVLNPVADTDTLKIVLNPIKRDIHKISLFDNTKPHADLILDLIRKDLAKINFFTVKKPAGAPATAQQIEKASRADLSILALADCGSCTAWVILDAIRLEKEGVPTISVCSHQFYPFARELAQWHGIGHLRIIQISHPIAGQSEKQVEEKTQGILPQIKDLLMMDKNSSK